MSRAWVERVRSLLEAPAPAGLTTYRKDGSAHTVPVWFRWNDPAVEVVIAEGDVKLGHLARDPRCVLVVFETVRPFRGMEAAGVLVSAALPRAAWIAEIDLHARHDAELWQEQRRHPPGGLDHNLPVHCCPQMHDGGLPRYAMRDGLAFCGRRTKVGTAAGLGRRQHLEARRTPQSGGVGSAGEDAGSPAR